MDEAGRGAEDVDEAAAASEDEVVAEDEDSERPCELRLIHSLALERCNVTESSKQVGQMPSVVPKPCVRG